MVTRGVFNPRPMTCVDVDGRRRPVEPPNGFINEAPLVLLLLYFKPYAVESATVLSLRRKASELKTLADIIT